MKARLSQGLTFQSKYDEAASFPEKQEIRNQDKIAGADTKIAVSTPLCPNQSTFSPRAGSITETPTAPAISKPPDSTRSADLRESTSIVSADSEHRRGGTDHRNKPSPEVLFSAYRH
jgi:hypothetical protein